LAIGRRLSFSMRKAKRTTFQGTILGDRAWAVGISYHKSKRSNRLPLGGFQKDRFADGLKASCRRKDDRGVDGSLAR
jgi:hypothetical protein